MKLKIKEISEVIHRKKEKKSKTMIEKISEKIDFDA